jgi:tetratricopeptide (TPR) repeat protein
LFGVIDRPSIAMASWQHNTYTNNLFFEALRIMSKPYSPSSAPEFAAQHDYSDILGTSLPPAKPVKQSKPSTSIRDPWASDIEIAPPDRSSLPFEAPVVEDLWASDLQIAAPTHHPRSPQIVKPTATAPVITPPHHSTQTAIAEQPATAPVINRQATIESEQPAVTAKDLALKYCERAKKALAARDYAQARSAYKIAIEWDSQLAIAHSGTAEICGEIQDYEGALVAWDLAIGCDATQVDFYYQRALINKILKNYYQVLADCKYILERDPERSSARWLNAVALVKLENYQLALSSLDRHVETFPQDPNGYCYRGICHERLEQLPQALADLDRAISLQANQSVFHHARGRTRQKLGDLPGALADFNLTINCKPRSAVYDDRAEVHRCLGNHLEALQDCDRAIELNPKFINAYFRRGLIYTELGDLELAVVDYTRTIDLEPQHINAHIQRSWSYFRQKDYQRAKQDCRTVKSFTKSCFWANYMSGVIASLSGMNHNAIENFSKAIEISPNYVSARYHRGIIYHQLGDIPKAMADFELARSIQDKGLERLVDRDETGFYAEGLALYHLGQTEAARTVLILGALSAKRFNNPSFHQLMLSQIETLGLASGELAVNASNSCSTNQKG